MAADGDSGNNFLQKLLHASEAGLDAKQVNAFADGAKSLLGQAKSGGWAINEEGGTHFLNAVKEAQDRLQQLGPRTMQLQRAPMLGNDQYAKKVARHMGDAMDSDDQSLVQVFNKFREGLGSIREAIETAKRNYNAADQDAVKRLGAFKD